MDDEPGKVFSLPLHLVKSTQSQVDKFQMLCCVEANISSAPYTSRRVMENTGYAREYDIILLVGLTELKAQICWEDAAVRVHIVHILCFAHDPNVVI